MEYLIGKSMKEIKKYNIVCLSNQPFDQPLKTNKWYVMTRLSSLGHNVIFVDPPTRFKGLKALLKGEISLLRFLSGIKKEAQNLVVYSPINLFNFKPFSRYNTFIHAAKINSLLSKFENKPVIVWIYHFDFPDLENFIKELKYDLLIYDVVDEYSAFPEYSDNKTVNKGLVALIQKLDTFLKIKLNQYGLAGKAWVEHREAWLVELADFIFASAPALVIKFQNILKKLEKSEDLVFFMPNAGDYNRFKNVRAYRDQVPEDLTKIPRPRIITAGAIDSYKMNLTLIEMCARAYPQYSFVLIGPEKVSDPDLDLRALKSLKNVYFPGTRANETMPYYFAGADAFIIPYNLNDYTIGCFPVKFHDALSAGLPVIVTNLPAYKPFVDVCYVAKNDEEYINLIKLALEEDSEKKFKERQAVAKENSWENKVENQLKIIDERLKLKLKAL